MGERFGYYMLNNILVLYMVKVLVLSSNHAYGIFSAFTALLYLSPLMGGPAIDRYLNNRIAVTIGGILISLGFILLSISEAQYLYFALATIICGKALYAPSTVAIIGKLYQKNDPGREGGFSIVYTAINISAIVPPLITASIILYFNWHFAFALAGVITLLGTFLFNIFSRDQIYIPKIQRSRHIFLAMGIILTIYFLALLIQNTHFTYVILSILSIFIILYGFKKSFTYPPHIRNQLLMCFILTTFSIIFFAFSQQSAMSLVLFIENHVNRNLGIFHVPTFFFFALNPFFVITLGPLLATLWSKLDIKKLNPSIPVKFALGTLSLGLGFIALLFGKINLIGVVIGYFFQSLGELFIYPIGLAMITEFSPQSMIGFMIGVWYFGAAIGCACAGLISQWTTSVTYDHVFGLLGCIAILASILLIGFIYYLRSSNLRIMSYAIK
jgi:proton-dependent oligopeptide transporter, POT family